MKFKVSLIGHGKSKTSVGKYLVEFNGFAEPSVHAEDSIWLVRQTLYLYASVCEKYAGRGLFANIINKKVIPYLKGLFYRSIEEKKHNPWNINFLWCHHRH